jgi:hypothetical protein
MNEETRMNDIRFEASVEGMEQLARHFEERLLRAEVRSSVLLGVVSVIVLELRQKQLVGQSLFDCLDAVEQRFKGQGIPAIDDEVGIAMAGLRAAMGVVERPSSRPGFGVIEGGAA